MRHRVKPILVEGTRPMLGAWQPAFHLMKERTWSDLLMQWIAGRPSWMRKPHYYSS